MRRPVPSKGAARDRHGRGAGCGGRGCAFDERRLMRTAKSCGPDASVVGVKPVEETLLATVSKKPDHRGEHEVTVTHCAGNAG